MRDQFGHSDADLERGDIEYTRAKEDGNLATAPRRCSTNIVGDFRGECLACGAANGETCLKPQRQ